MLVCLDFAPSFGEMGIAIASAVESSGLQVSDLTADDATADLTEVTPADLHLTPAQQLVLSCVWLNIKVCATNYLYLREYLVVL